MGAWATPNASSSTILVVGDSLSAEYGLRRGTGWVALMEKTLQAEGRNVVVANASVSGDTTSGGRSRLGALLTRHKPQVVIIELGGNDALRGLPLLDTRENLTSMVKMSQSQGARVILVGMQVPPNYGQDYANQFAALFGTVAKSTKAELVPFLLRGVADRPDAARLFQADHIHPLEAAHPQMLSNVLPTVKKLLR